MKRTLFPGYSVGTDAYEDIKEICPAYGKKGGDNRRQARTRRGAG
ncbi:MAG TPA: hypothetical protein OIM14_05140 [Oscillospiraceae bacterium]|nr:hypothetical protein [Oscillospiraceae bacterium]